MAFLAYAPSLSGVFIWNDSDYVTAPWMRGTSGLRAIWLRPGATQQYYPLLHSFFWMQQRLWGDHPLGYRLTTLCLHALAAVLFGLVVEKLLSGRGEEGTSRSFSIGLATAAIFVVHPVNVESVAWISEQKNTLSLALFLAATWVYLRFDQFRRRTDYAVALACFAAALLAKTMVATLPADLLVILWWQRGSLRWRRDIVPLLPWFILAASLGYFTSWVERHFVGAQGPEFVLSPSERILVAGRAIISYASKLAWPRRLNFVYPRWGLDASAWWQWTFPVAVVAVGAALWAIRRRTRAPLAAFLFFAGSLFPVLGFVTLYGARYSWTWDHWQYLPDLGPLFLFVAALSAATRLGGSDRRWAFAGSVAALTLVLGSLTWAHCQMFRDDEDLYRTTLATDPASWMAQNNLGRLLLDRGANEEARSHLEDAIRLNPKYPEAHNNLSIYFLKTGSRDAGIAELRAALKYNPELSDARRNLGLALIETPEGSEEGILQLEAALREDPNGPQAALLHAKLGNALGKMPGRASDAITELKSAAQIEPRNSEIRGSLGIALFRSGRIAEATNEFEAAIGLDPSNGRAHNALGIVLAVSGQKERAIAEFERALELDPGLAEARKNLALARGASDSAQ